MGDKINNLIAQMLQQAYLMSHLNNLSLPENGGCLTEGSNQVGVRITAFMWLKRSNPNLP
jgi:hypothetical protein